jgi:hypothetical protein
MEISPASRMPSAVMPTAPCRLRAVCMPSACRLHATGPGLVLEQLALLGR